MKKRVKYIILAVIVLVVAVIVLLYFRDKNSKVENKDGSNSDITKKVNDRTFEIVKGDLPIGLLQGGSINASKKHKLALKANWTTTLLWVIEENSWVEEGDVLIELDTEQLVTQIENTEIDLDTLKKELDLVIEDQIILESSNQVSLKEAEDSLIQAEDALEKYMKITRITQLEEYDRAITSAKLDLKDEQETYEELRDEEVESEDDKDADTIKRENLDAQQIKVDDAKVALNNANSNRLAWLKYDHPTKIVVLENAVEKARLNSRKTKISVNSQVVQKQKQVENYRKRIATTSKHLERYKSYMDMMVIKSPVAGVVIYSDPDQRWGRVEVQVGMDVKKGPVLITIPEMSNLIVDFDIPEDYRSKVKIGDVAYLAPDSLPGQKYTGTISEIATLPVNLVSWDSSSPKVYKSRIKLDKQSEELVNGMSVQITVVTKVLRDVIYVPVESIFEDNERFYVYTDNFTGVDEVDVTIGESNDNFVEIKAGLEEGDVVYLYRPYEGKQGDK